MNDAKKRDLTLSITVIVILIVVNLIEFWFATVIKSFPVIAFTMLLLAAIDVAIIMYYYMHFFRLFDADDQGGH
jgi:heme/copper-type cytochrome/quinol oxidase subunit 4